MGRINAEKFAALMKDYEKIAAERKARGIMPGHVEIERDWDEILKRLETSNQAHEAHKNLRPTPRVPIEFWPSPAM